MQCPRLKIHRENGQDAGSEKHSQFLKFGEIGFSVKHLGTYTIMCYLLQRSGYCFLAASIWMVYICDYYRSGKNRPMLYTSVK